LTKPELTNFILFPDHRHRPCRRLQAAGRVPHEGVLPAHAPEVLHHKGEEGRRHPVLGLHDGRGEHFSNKVMKSTWHRALT